jgi:uroporphyrinogen decarboxylase
MNPRERILNTLRFQPVDRPAFDLMEGILWPEIMDYFQKQHGLATADEVIEFLDPDIRWTTITYTVSPEETGHVQLDSGIYSEPVSVGPLYDATQVAEVEKFNWPEHSFWKVPDVRAARARFPQYALALLAWKPLFLTACDIFGMEGALTKMLTHPQVFEAAIARKHAINMQLFERCMQVADDVCDIFWIGDDFAGQHSLLMNPKLWRKLIKPYLAEEVQLARSHGLVVLYHSCGAVSAVLDDLLEIGISGLGVFQTSASGMDPHTIAKRFGGRFAFYGGIDVQTLLSFGTPAEVEAQVKTNLEAFAGCGGYILSNSHRIDTIRGENLEAMFRAVKAAG